MEKKLQEKLYQKFPRLFREKDLPKTQTCMCWGITCGDGWYNLLEGLCIELTTYAKEAELDIAAIQVKEKFAGLRFYVSEGDEKAHQIISKYEGMSYKTCELCGGEGKQRNDGWLHTICDACWKKWQTGWRPWEEK